MIHEANVLEIKHPDLENSLTNVSKRIKVTMKTSSDHEGEEQFKCDICDARFASKGGMNCHIAL